MHDVIPTALQPGKPGPARLDARTVFSLFNGSAGDDVISLLCAAQDEGMHSV